MFSLTGGSAFVFSITAGGLPFQQCHCITNNQVPSCACAACAAIEASSPGARHNLAQDARRTAQVTACCGIHAAHLKGSAGSPQISTTYSTTYAGTLGHINMSYDIPNSKIKY
jgi:hypothetical protein